MSVMISKEIKSQLKIILPHLRSERTSAKKKAPHPGSAQTLSPAHEGIREAQRGLPLMFGRCRKIHALRWDFDTDLKKDWS